MPSKDIRIRSREGGEFDCYLATPDAGAQVRGGVPAVVVASSVYGVDADVRAIADEFARQGYIAAAPDLFWRSLPGPLAPPDERAARRSQPRLEKIRAGEPDMADTLAEVRRLPQSNGRAAVMGFCYGGPYAIVGPKRLGYDAGVSCHGTQLLSFIDELDGLARPVCILWGDRDHAAPPEVLAAYRGVPARMSNVEVHVFPGVLHSYMMRRDAKAFDPEKYDFSMGRALAILAGLHSTASIQSAM